MFEIWFSYQEHKASLIRIQHEQAEAAAAKIGQFIKEIESQVGWTTQLPWSAGTIEQRRTDGQRLLRQVPAITELAQLDSSGKEQLKVSRLAMDVVGSQADLSQDPKFTEAVAHKVYYGPVYFRRESEPYMTLALAGTRRDAGVSVAEVNLKLIWDVILQIKVGERGQAYVVDAQGRLIAHPDISLVLRNTDMTQLAQVKAARAAGGHQSHLRPHSPYQLSRRVSFPSREKPKDCSRSRFWDGKTSKACLPSTSRCCRTSIPSRPSTFPDFSKPCASSRQAMRFASCSRSSGRSWREMRPLEWRTPPAATAGSPSASRRAVISVRP